MADKFDTELLISMVKMRPLLWDKSLESHKDLDHRSAAWREICRVLCPDYETLSRKDKHLYAKSVIKKWTNIRDAWRKSLVESKLKKKAKPYVYHDYLRFLEKNLYHVKDSFLGDDNNKNYEKEDAERLDRLSLVDSDDAADQLGRHKRPRGEDARDADGAQAMDAKGAAGQDDNPHVCFLRGLLPTLNKLNEDEVLEFQGGVIQLLQNIRKKDTSFLNDVITYLPSSSIDLSDMKADSGDVNGVNDQMF